MNKHLKEFTVKNAIIFLFLCILLIEPSVQIIPSKPIVVSPNTQSSPSNFIFSFILQKQLQSTGYLMITFSPLISSAIPKSCIMIDSTNTSLYVQQCVNLDDVYSLSSTNINYITVNKTLINAINPNIDSTKTVVIRFSEKLIKNQQYSIQIITNNVLPAIGSITSNFQFYTISSTGFMIEQNWNFGQVYFQRKQNNILSVNSINDLTQNQPGSLSSNLQFQISIKVPCPTSYSRLKFMISNDFQFSPSSRVIIQGILSTPPQIKQTQIISPNIIITTFSQQFVQNRKFKLTITDIKNPLKISTGHVSVYYLPFNSMSPLELKELSIPIGTKQYTPTVQVLTGLGITNTSPVQFYEQKQQYLTVNVILKRQCDQGFIIQVLTDQLIIQEGTTYAKAANIIAQKLIYTKYTSKGVRISGFSLIPQGTKITITFKAWIPSNVPSFNIKVSIDKQSQILNPIMLGNAPTIDTIVPTDFILDFKGNQNQANKLSSMTSSDSSLFFVVYPTFSTISDSSLIITTSKNLVGSANFNGSASCLINGTARICSISSTTDLTVLTINSGPSNNFFPINCNTSIQINNLKFNFVSSNTEYIYHFYFQITSLSSTNPIIKKTILTPQVIPQRNLLSGLSNYFSNDLYNTGLNYMNIFRLVSTVPSEWNYIVQSTQRRMISVFAKEKWTKLFTKLKSGDQYPLLSSLSGVNSTYIQGTTTNNTINCPLSWDKIDLILPGTQNTTKFSIAIPLTYSTDTTFNFQIMVGIYNIQTRVITYKFIEPKPQLGSPTYKKFTSFVSVSSKPKRTNTKIQLSGNAGSYKDNVTITVSPAVSGTFSGASYSTALIIMSSWNWFESSTTFNNISTTSTNPLFLFNQQKPISMKIDTDIYLTYIPFMTLGTYSSEFSIVLNSVKLPYTHDLPYYSILLIDQTGTIDSYNQFINQDQGVFYQSYLNKFQFQCSDNSLGVTNTDCRLNFIPYQQIQIKNKIYLTLIGLKVSTDKCQFRKLSDFNVLIPLTCLSNRDKNQLIVTLNSVSRLPALEEYQLKIYGMSIEDSTIIHYTDMTIRDNSGGYIIQKGTRILLTSVSMKFPIFISQLTYLKNNPIVVSGFKIIFQLPRQLNNDQVFALVMSNDLSNLNSIPCKLNIKLFIHGNNTEIQNVRWFLNIKNYQIIFQGLNGVLGTDKYRLEIYGLKTPSSISQNIISLIYFRTFDNTYTIENTDQSTSVYPSLSQKVNSLITMQSYFNTQGLQQPLIFTITNQYQQVTAQTVWYITLPRYYSQNIWNKNYLTYCRIDKIKLQCMKDQYIPYTIKVLKSPKIIQIGDTYQIQINGVVCPRKSYVNGNPIYITESIFFGVAVNEQAESYVQYSQLYISQTVINPQQLTNYGTVTITEILSSNSQTHQTTYFTLKIKSTVSIEPTNYIFVQFPEGFNNFNDLLMEGEIQSNGLVKPFVGDVINTRMGFQVPIGFTVGPNTDISIKISSLPTPKYQISSDMNQLQVIITQSTRMSTKAASLQLHNIVTNSTYNTTQLHIVINNYTIVQITAGTYSDPVPVTSSDNNPFVSNIRIQFNSNSLMYEPQITYLLVGDMNNKFKIGAEQTLIPTTYTYQITKSQTSISAFYMALTRYSVRVTNKAVNIQIPSSITVPLGGCSIPFKIQLKNAPFSDIQMKFQYDSFQYTLDQFWLNYEISYNQLQFTKSMTDRWVSFCAAPTFDANELPVSIYLGGSNAQSYNLSTKTINVKIIPNTTTNINPSISLTIANTQKTYTKFNLTTNIQGLLFYQLKLSPLSTPLQLLNLKKLIKQKNLILQSNQDYVNKQIYLKDRDHRIDFKPIPAGISFLQFQNLLPQRNYTLCVFFENQHRVSTNRICQSFSMQNWGIITKYYIKFNGNSVFQSQLNNVLCYFAKASNSQITQVVDLEGKSCSFYSTANNYHFTYNGSMITNQLSSTYIYHISDKNLTTDPSNSAFSALYDANGISASSLSVALANFSINYIQKSTQVDAYDPIQMIQMSKEAFRPKLSFKIDKYIEGSYQLRFRNIQMSKTGSAYFILTSYKRIFRDQISAHVDIQIRPLMSPSYSQILNCKDGYDQDPIYCKRVVIKQDESLSFIFNDIKQNRIYVIYYIITNEYPLRPIVYGEVGMEQISTVVNWQKKLTFTFFLFSLIIINIIF